MKELYKLQDIMSDDYGVEIMVSPKGKIICEEEDYSLVCNLLNEMGAVHTDYQVNSDDRIFIDVHLI